MRESYSLEKLVRSEVFTESRFLGLTVMALGGAYCVYDAVLQYLIHK